MTDERRAVAAIPEACERSRSPIGGDVTYLVRGRETDGAMTALDVIVPPGEGPALHVHGREAEGLYVVSGGLRFRLGDEIRDTPAGSFVFVPSGVAHCFQNTGDEPARMLVTFTPAGMEGFFEELARLDAVDPAAFRDAAGGYGMTVVGPPLAQSHPL
jgi:mannose-6-phosphate isomerase-like protein (cupin superfamily)